MADQTRYGYMVLTDIKGEMSVITMRTRHDATGLCAVLERNLDAEYWVEPTRRSDVSDLPTLNGVAGSDKGATA